MVDAPTAAAVLEANGLAMGDLDVEHSVAWDHPSLERAQRVWSQSGELQQLMRMDTVRERTRVVNMPAGCVEAPGVTE